MSDMVKLLRNGTPCRRTTGHGESCANGYECDACRIRLLASDELERLEKEAGALRYAALQVVTTHGHYRSSIDALRAALNPLPPKDCG